MITTIIEWIGYGILGLGLLFLSGKKGAKNPKTRLVGYGICSIAGLFLVPLCLMVEPKLYAALAGSVFGAINNVRGAYSNYKEMKKLKLQFENLKDEISNQTKIPKKALFGTRLNFEDLYPDTYRYTPPESLKNLEEFFKKKR